MVRASKEEEHKDNGHSIKGRGTKRQWSGHQRERMHYSSLIAQRHWSGHQRERNTKTMARAAKGEEHKDNGQGVKVRGTQIQWSGHQMERTTKTMVRASKGEEHKHQGMYQVLRDTSGNLLRQH